MSHYSENLNEIKDEETAEIKLWLNTMIERMNYDDVIYLRKVVNDLEEYKSFEKFINKISEGNS